MDLLIFERPKEESTEEKNRKAPQSEILEQLLKEIDESAAKIRSMSASDDLEGLLRELNKGTLEEKIFLIGDLLEESIRSLSEKYTLPPETKGIKSEYIQSVTLELERLSPPPFITQQNAESSCSQALAVDASSQAIALTCAKGHILELREKAEGKVDDKTIKQIEDAYWRTVGLIEDLEKDCTKGPQNKANPLLSMAA